MPSRLLLFIMANHRDELLLSVMYTPCHIPRPHSLVHLESALSANSSAECPPLPPILCQTMRLHALHPENSQGGLKSNGCWGPYNLHNGKTNG